MFSVQNIFVVYLFQIVHSEWIEILQSAHSSSEIANNRSMVINNENAFDYSTYKDFFSILEPKMEFTKDILLQKNPPNDSINSNKLNQNDDLHIVMANPTNLFDQTEQNHLLMHSSNVSKLQSGFSDASEKMVINPIRIDSFGIKTDNTNDKSLNKIGKNLSNNNKSQTEAKRVVFKRLRLKPFHFNDILKFLTNMQQAFSLNTLTGIGDKVKFLIQFKDNILENIG